MQPRALSAPALAAVAAIALALWLMDGAMRSYVSMTVLDAVASDLAIAELDRAADRLDTALRRDRIHPDLLAELGRVETMRVLWRDDPKAVVSAERAYLLAIDARPDDAAVWSELGWSRLRTGRPTLAVSAFLRALARDPNNAFYHASLGRAHEDAGNLDAALDAYQLAQRLVPSNAVATRLEALQRLQEVSSDDDAPDSGQP